MDTDVCTSLYGGSMGGCEIDMQDDSVGNLPTNDLSSNSNEPNRDNGEIVEAPKLGMEFTSTEAASKFYIDYAGKTGFKARKNHHKKNVKGLVTRVTFCCSKEGYRKQDKRSENALYKKPVSRVGCMAQMTCLLQKNGRYKIVSFNAKHNHELMVKINQGISESQMAHADGANKSWIPVKATVELTSKEIVGRKHLEFLGKDHQNYIHGKRQIAMEKGDAGAILQFCQKMQSENSSFFYSTQLDEDDIITNIFWADERSVSDYGLFGDVVCFDTTYRTNDYGRPFAPFVGVNHHKQTVVFGASLLYDETIDSYKWLFETFLNAMSGKQPRTILTDQSAAMSTAISQVFTETYHRLCVWHIYQNAAKNLSHVFHESQKFADDFSKCIYDCEDEDEWLSTWDKMLEHYGLKENKWLKSQFELKENWALVYGRHAFTADIKATQRSENMNNVFKQYLKPRHGLLHFFEQYESVLADQRYEELLADFKIMQTTPVMLTSAQMLLHGVEVYTPEVFQLFQDEYVKILNCSTYKVGKDGSTSHYRVCYTGKTQEHLVGFDAATQAVTCSCMKFTFVGILCAHALRVLDKKNVKRIPPQYIVKRWSKNAKARSIINYDGVETRDNLKESIGKRYSHLCRNFREIAYCASEHEKLFAYAHEQSVDLLHNLEKMKKHLA